MSHFIKYLPFHIRHLDESSSPTSPDDNEETHEYDAHNVLLLNITLILCVFIAYLIKRNRFYAVPESAAAMLTGIVIGGLVRLASPEQDKLPFLYFNAEVFFFLLLPPIIFEAGYTLRRKR